MSTTVETSFSRHFQIEVHLAYQRMGSKLRNTVRTKNDIKGSSTTFQKVGKGTASTKARHGKVPVMNIDHTPVEIALQDYYAGDWVDALDEIKMAHDERSVVTNAGAYALGRKTGGLTQRQAINPIRPARFLSGAMVPPGSGQRLERPLGQGMKISQPARSHRPRSRNGTTGPSRQANPNAGPLLLRRASRHCHQRSLC
jgi:hypothetical protein